MSWIAPHDFTEGEFWLEEYGDAIRDDFLYLWKVSWEKSALQVPTGAWDTPSNSLITWNPAAPLNITFTKRGGAETQLRFDIAGRGFITGGATSLVQWGINVGGADFQSFRPHYWSTADDYDDMDDVIHVPGLAAGAYTAQLRVLVVPGGFNFNVDGNAYAAMTVREVYVQG